MRLEHGLDAFKKGGRRRTLKDAHSSSKIVDPSSSLKSSSDNSSGRDKIVCEDVVQVALDQWQLVGRSHS